LEAAIVTNTDQIGFRFGISKVQASRDHFQQRECNGGLTIPAGSAYALADRPTANAASAHARQDVVPLVRFDTCKVRALYVQLGGRSHAG
jgi:hypothetical protein